MPDSHLFYRSRRQTRNALTLATFLTATVLTAGCSNLGVKPWERDLLADPDMQLTVSGVDAGLDDHIYFSKEASSGGRGFGGGGCGCN
ncbi:hypothetical protein GCM10011533_02060 [Streptosporangium jomthongense]|uniref:DUF4266 domain-containing protein n=1 Tax=Marinobacter aromaticivorans TaxID=1494078 RepID=A0ABW2IQV6_9GAMM|nr:DUF4266 domain-containing protein [Marinobacter aromaticivorans]GGE53225.1 hypothetical protein GCM10011533_02060 [Streptosporangium jomthongense]